MIPTPIFETIMLIMGVAWLWILILGATDDDDDGTGYGYWSYTKYKR